MVFELTIVSATRFNKTVPSLEKQIKGKLWSQGQWKKTQLKKKYVVGVATVETGEVDLHLFNSHRSEVINQEPQTS